MTKVFITGATGFIGTHLVRRLSKSGYELCCLVRRTSSTVGIKDLGAGLVVGDVTDKASVLRGMSGCEWAVNLANVYSMWEADKSVYRAVNVVGTRNVMECALAAGVRKVVHVSTAGVYGRPADCPFTENSPPGPKRFSEYTRTKYEGERVAWQLYEREGLPLVAIYPGAVLGPGDTKPTGRYIRDMVSRRMPVTVCDDVVMTYVHVRDVADGIALAAEKEENIGEKYLIGKFQLSFGELNRLIGEISGVPPPSMRLPDPLMTASAAVLTLVSALTKRPPPWGMSADQASMAREGFRFSGSKAERELGLSYTPIRAALEEAIEALTK